MKALAILGVVLLVACSGKSPSTQEAPGSSASSDGKALNLFIWAELLAPDTLSGFEKATGIKVTETNYASLEEEDSKLATGKTGFDVILTSGSFYARQIQNGYYQKLDKSKLPNLANMDPEVMQEMQTYDPGNEYAVMHTWGTMGLGYNIGKVRAAAPDAPLDSWQLLFDPKNASRLQKCGIAIVDSASDAFSIALIAIGKDSNSQIPADLEAAAAALMKIRPYVRYINTAPQTADLANGEICVAAGYNGDALWARNRARENHTGQEIAFIQPKEGSVSWMNSFLIPKDAPHLEAAHAFLNYMLKPEVIATITNTIRLSNGNAAAAPFVKKDILEDPGIYPGPEIRAKLDLERPDTIETRRLMTRLWTRFVTGS